MKKILIVFGVLAVLMLDAVEWDFTKPGVLKGKYALAVRGKSAVTKAGLVVPVGKSSERAGAATVKNYHDIIPQGSFSAAVDFIIDGTAKHIQSYLVLLDNKYNIKSNYGFMLYLRKKKADVFVTQVVLGYCDKSVNVYGSDLKIASGKKHTLVMNYDVNGKVDFVFDGKNEISIYICMVNG